MNRLFLLMLLSVFGAQLFAQWEITHFKDAYGDLSTEQGIICKIEGIFSNSAVSNKDVTVVIQVHPEKKTMFFSFYEYSGDNVRNFVAYKQGDASAIIKLANGKTKKMLFYMHRRSLERDYSLGSKLYKTLMTESKPFKMIVNVSPFTTYYFEVPIYNFKSYHEQLSEK